MSARAARRLACLVAVGVVTAVPAHAAPVAVAGLPAPKIAAVETAISTEMSRREIPGLSAAIVMDLELRWSGGYGLADIENNVPAKASTVYRLGSISKTITATAVLQLVEKGRLDLEAPIQRYVPTFPDKPWPITPRLLLAHLSGVRHYAEGEFRSTRHYTSLTEALAIFKDDPLVQEPGTRFLYSTYGFNLLGCVVEGASGTPFLDYLRHSIFVPAGMEHAQADDVLAIIPHRAQGYQRILSGELRNSELADTSNKIPGGGMVATAEDVAHFARALQGGVLLQKESLSRMLARQTARDGKPTGYGLGIFLADRAGVREAWHTGGQQRVSTVMYMQPDRRLAVVLLANVEGIGSNLLDLARQVADTLTR